MRNRFRSWMVIAAAATSTAIACGGNDSTDETMSEDAGADVQNPDAHANVIDANAMDAQIDGTIAVNDASEAESAIEDAGAVSDASDAFSMKTWTPGAKGLWIWYFDYVGMTAAEAAIKAQADGVGYVLIKSGQDEDFWSTRFNAANLAEFTSRGMRVLAWPYITPASIAASITAAAEAANTPGCDGLVLDVEVEWETGGDHSADAQTLCQGIRSAAPGVWLGYTSFGWIGYHPDFPFKAFDTYCGDSFWPQVYYSDRGVTWNGADGLSQALSMYKTAALHAPLWPIQSNDTIYDSDASPTTADLNGFFDAAGAYSSLWEFPASGETSKVNQLANLDWKNP
jgi:hypothetical protein